MPTTPRNTRAQSASQSQSQSQSSSQSQPLPQTRSAPRRSNVPVVELPSSRSSKKGSSSTTTNTSTPPKTRQRSTKSASATPTNQHPHLHHHVTTADDLAIKEAEEILGHDLEVHHGDARSRRHDRLSRLRSVSQPPGPEIELGEEVLQEEEVKGESAVPASGEDDELELSVETLGEQVEEEEDKSQGGVKIVEREKSDETVIAVPNLENDSPEPNYIGEKSSVVSTSSGSVSDSGESDNAAKVQPAVQTVEVVDVTSSSDDSSDSDSDSESEADTDDDEDDAELEKLLQSAKLSAAKSAQEKNERNTLGGDGDVVSFGEDDQETQRRKEAPIPDISITKLPKPHLSFSADGSARATDAAPIIAGPSRIRSNEGVKVPELDARPYERAMSKREKAAQPRKATASELWSTLPAPKADLLSQMKRDYQALSLTNSLDPKRFMKGGNRSGKIPESFAIGTLVEAPRHLQDTTLTRERQYRPGQLVQSLTRDEDTGSYAKRKYGDLQSKRMENGRGNGWKKQRGWKP